MKTKLVFITALIISACASPGNKVKHIVLENKGNILYPEDIEHIPLEWEKISHEFSYEYQLKNIGNNSLDSTSKFDVVNKSNGLYFFNKYIDGKLISRPEIVFKNGIEHHKYKSQLRPYLPYGGCLHVIGECKFEGLRNKKVIVTTSFKNGVWTSKYNSPGRSYRPTTITSVYDKLGLLIYRRFTAKSLSFPVDNETMRKY